MAEPDESVRRGFAVCIPAGVPRLTPMPAVLLLLLPLAACTGSDRSLLAAVAGGDSGRGAQVIQSFDCGSCHVIPGIRGANGLVGPPLTRMARRSYIAGRLPNRPDENVQTIRAISSEAVGSPRFTTTARDTLEKIIETVFMALVATTFATLLAVPWGLEGFCAGMVVSDAAALAIQRTMSRRVVRDLPIRFDITLLSVLFVAVAARGVCLTVFGW